MAQELDAERLIFIDECGTHTSLAPFYYVEWVLAPDPSAGQVVVMNDLAAHKGERVRELTKAWE